MSEPTLYQIDWVDDKDFWFPLVDNMKAHGVLVPVEPDYEAAEKALSRGEPSFVIVNDAMGIGGDE